MSTVLDTLITDGTADGPADDTDRACIAYIGLSRAEQACALLAGLLYVDIRTKEQGMEDSRTDTEMARLLRSIKALRAAYFTKTSMLVIPARTTYSNVYQTNGIEQIPKDLGDMYDSVVSRQQRLSPKLGVKAIGNRRQIWH